MSVPPAYNNGQDPNQPYNQGYNQGYNNQGYQQAPNPYQQGYNQGPQQGYQQPYPPQYQQGNYGGGYPYGYYPGQPTPQFLANDIFASSPEGKSRGVAALLALFIGSLGIHLFYVGKNTGGIIYILIFVFTCGLVTSIMSLIQAIMLFCMTNEEFRNKYILGTSTIPF